MGSPVQEKRRQLLDIYVDADGCPVKDETYRVAERYGLKVILVADSRMRVPDEDWIELVVVSGGFDAADDWIADHVQENDIVVTGDIPLADRCLKQGARALSPRGRVYREDSIGQALATRDFLAHLRELGMDSGGPAPFERRDRSQFLQRLDEIVQAIRRGK
jgi:uncharacterized protein YaiI (UPF0178 family)